jgi:G:T/U-mismatch repair DNA glycosylase
MNKVNLQEILHPKMDILFVALNPPETSNMNGHYFSRNMSFWNLLFNAGLITQKVLLPISGDTEVFLNNKINYKKSVFGITDLVHDKVETKSRKVKPTRSNIERILSILKSKKVKILCLVHAEVGKAFEFVPTLNRDKKYGQIGKIDSTIVFEMPFHNASIAHKHLYYKSILNSL